MRLITRLSIPLLCCFGTASFALCETSSRPLQPEDRAAFEAVIRDYLMKNPAVVRDALDKLRADEQAAAAQRAKAALTAERAQLINDAGSPWIGSANPDVTVVEFFDYRCGFCKQVSAALEKLAATDPKVRIVFKNYPILGAESSYAARVSQAARRDPKFAQFHAAMLAAPSYTPDTVRKIAADTGVDPELFRNLETPEISAQLEKNVKLAAALSVTGTPALVVGDQITPGAVGFEALAALVAAERAKSAR